MVQTVDLFGDVSTTLVTQQSSRQPSNNAARAIRHQDAGAARLERWHRGWVAQVKVAEPVEVHYRHRGWMPDRRRVRDALVRARVSTARLDRYDNCGAGCRVEIAADGSRARLKAQYCGDRWCVPCCRARAVRHTANIERLGDGQTLRLCTLTVRPAGQTLVECLNHTLASFERLRATTGWRRAVKGGVACVEITRGSTGRSWHVHIHCVLAGGYLDHGRLRELWRVASRGSYIVDIRLIRDGHVGVAYVAKYASKGWSHDVLHDPAALDEAMAAMRGRRLIKTFGAWYNADVDAEPADTREYVSAGSLASIVAKAAAGDEWAKGVLLMLRVPACVELLDRGGRGASESAAAGP